MPTRITSTPVVDRNKYKGKLVFLDSQGYLAVADRPKGKTEAEKQATRDARAKAQSVRSAQKKADRSLVQSAKKEVNRNPSVATAKAYEEAVKRFNDKWG